MSQATTRDRREPSFSRYSHHRSTSGRSSSSIDRRSAIRPTYAVEARDEVGAKDRRGRLKADGHFTVGDAPHDLDSGLSGQSVRLGRDKRALDHRADGIPYLSDNDGTSSRSILSRRPWWQSLVDLRLQETLRHAGAERALEEGRHSRGASHIAVRLEEHLDIRDARGVPGRGYVAPANAHGRTKAGTEVYLARGRAFRQHDAAVRTHARARCDCFDHRLRRALGWLL